ncbi:TldD/PmbA family protein [Bacteroidota bacterium]
MDYKNLTEKLVNKCISKGADSAEVYLQDGRQLNIEVRNGDVETIQENSSHGVGFRLFVKGKMAFSFCSDFSDKALDKSIESAVRFARHTTSDENNVLPDNKEVTVVDGIYDPEIAKISIDNKIELAKKVEDIAMQDSRITKSAGAVYGEAESEIYIANSNGLLKNYKLSGCSYGVSVVAEKGEQKSPGGKYCSRRFYSDLKTPEEIAVEAAEKAWKKLDPRKVKTQKAVVIFDTDVAGTILGGVLGAINGESVLQGASFLADKMGKKISSELITMIDDGTLTKGMSTAPFDGEGVPTQNRVIVDNGILRGFMYNTIVAKRAGVKSTGNAARGGFTALPGIGAHNFYIANGNSSFEDIIKSTKNGLLLNGVTGYGINPVNGNFSGGASGFWVKNGEIIFPVKGLTIAGTAFEMFNGIDMLGNNLKPTKNFTAPTIRIREMQIGGE